MSSKTLTVLVIISLMFLTTSGLWFFHYLPKLRGISTSNLAYAIEYHLDEFKKETGSYPGGDASDVLHQLRGNNTLQKRFIKSDSGIKIEGNQFVDEWGNPFAIEIPDKGVESSPVVRSPGKNGLFGDDDDITSSIVRQILIDRGEKPVGDE